jgi:PST family polysaccharide transporter
MVSLVVLARLLGPADFGLVAMVTAIVGVGEVFRDFGLSSASIQAKNVSKSQRSNLFWVNASIGVGLALIAWACSPLVASLYSDPAVSTVMVACASTFVINGIATQHRADLNRQLRFGVLALVDTAAQILAVAAAIVVAATGGGYWALVLMTVSQAAFSLVGVLTFGHWMPRWYTRGEPMKAFFKFGAGVAGSQLLGYASKNVDAVVLGVTLGPTAVGFYNRAYQVLMLPLNQFQAPSTRVALPVLSRLNDDPQRYRAFLLRGQTILLHAVGVVLSVSAAQAAPLFAIVLGAEWGESVPIFQALVVGGLASMANYACYWVFLSKGLTISYLWFSIVTRPFVIGAVVAGAFIAGPVGVGIAFSAVSLLMWPVTLWWLSRVSDAPVLRMLSNGSRAFLIYTVAGTASWIATTWAPSSVLPSAVSLALGALAFIAALGMCYLLVPAYKTDIRAIADTRRFFRKGRS